jgi:SAM-dependent methyltransferase
MIICPDCGASMSEPNVLACTGCGWKGEKTNGVAVYLSTRDREDPILREYFENYDRISADDLRSSILDERYLENQARNLARYIPELRNRRVCDVGCGKGYLARQLVACGAERMTVVDLAMGYLRRMSDEAFIPVLANAENLPFADAFDIIAATDIMEHVLNVGSFIYALNRALVIGGEAYIRVPYRENLLPYSPHLDCQYRFVHLRSFDVDTLRVYFESAGFVIDGFRFDGYWLQRPQGFWQSGWLRQRLYQRFERVATKRLRHYTDVTSWNQWLARMLMVPLEIVVIARKVHSIEKQGKGAYVLR